MHPTRPPVPDLEAGRAEAEVALSLSVRSVSSRRASYAPEGGGGRSAPSALARDPARDDDPSTSQAARALALNPPASGGDMAAEEGVAKVVDGSGGKAPPPPPPTTTTTTQGLLQRRRGGGGGRGCGQPCLTIPRRPNTWDFKTRESEWRARHSMWRYVQGTCFFIGPPDFLIKESACESVEARGKRKTRQAGHPPFPSVCMRWRRNLTLATPPPSISRPLSLSLPPSLPLSPSLSSLYLISLAARPVQLGHRAPRGHGLHPDGRLPHR